MRLNLHVCEKRTINSTSQPYDHTAYCERLIPNKLQPKRPTTAKKPRSGRRQAASNTTGASQSSAISFPRRYALADPFPSTMRRTFTYCQNYTLSSGTAVLGTQQVFRMNSLYDPDYTGAGHQPYGYDQVSGLYQNYRVDSCKFDIVFTTPGAANDMICVATVAPGTDASLTGATLFTVPEKPGGIWGILSSSGDRRCVLRGKFDNNVICGVPKAKYVAEDNFASPVSTNPSQNILLTTNVGCVDGTASVSCAVLIVITYTAVLYDRVTQSTS